jgi:PAS domain S-box-containing protein
MLLIDPNTGKIVDSNPVASSFYGYSHEDLVKMNIKQINNLSDNDVQGEMQKSKTFKKNTSYLDIRWQMEKYVMWMFIAAQ